MSNNTAKILSPLELDTRVQELEQLLKGIRANLRVIRYSCDVDGCVAGKNLSEEALDWIVQHNIPE